MKKLILLILVSLLFTVSFNAQTTPPPAKTTKMTDTEKPKRQIFRSNKDQVAQAQKMLKGKSMYSGDETGKLDPDTRAGLKKFQSENGLKATGTLNRATLEKMNIELTDKQKEMPISPNSYAAADSDKSAKPKRNIFRTTKDQIMQAQKMLKSKSMYGGDETGKLDDTTREGLKKYQEANGLKSTGTLNQVTLEKMGIELTDKQKENAKMDPK